MYDYEPEIEDKDLKKVGLELMFMTPEKGAVENWGRNPPIWKEH